MTIWIKRILPFAALLAGFTGWLALILMGGWVGSLALFSPPLFIVGLATLDKALE